MGNAPRRCYSLSVRSATEALCCLVGDFDGEGAISVGVGVEGGIDYIKRQLYKVMKACELDEAKGQMGYKFVPTISQTTEVNKEFLNEKYAYLLNDALEYYKVNFGVELPEWVSYSLGASVKTFREVTNGECELPGEFILTETETCRFSKPRASKKNDGEDC